MFKNDKRKYQEYKIARKYTDLHSHSTYSDGELEPIDLLNRAIEKRVKYFSITDHDDLGGIKDIRENHMDIVNRSGIELINGVELSAQVSKGIMHILGYNFDIYNKELNDKLIELKTNSYYSMVSYLNGLRDDYGIKFDSSDIRDLFNIKGNIGRPHLAHLLIKYKYVDSVEDAFQKYLIDVYEKARSFNKKPSYEECISLIKGAGGLAVLAHPLSLKQDKIELLKTVRDMVDCGLDGIEVFHSSHSLDNMSDYMDIVKRYKLLYTAGSDFHGEHVKPGIELGTGKDDNLRIDSVTLVRKISKL